MFIGAHEAEYMFVTTLLKIEQHLLAQGRCPYSYLGAKQIQLLLISMPPKPKAVCWAG